MAKYEKVIYISHKFGGDKNNIEEIENIVRCLVKIHPQYLFVSPVHAFGYLYDDVDYDTGLDYTLWLLGKCDEVWVTGSEWSSSKGVLAEIDYCKNNGIPYKILWEQGE